MQLDLFNDISNYEKIVIPESVKSPIEVSHGLSTEAFRDTQVTFSNYIKAIQDYHRCNWLDARKLFFKHRESKEPIKVKRGVISG